MPSLYACSCPFDTIPNMAQEQTTGRALFPFGHCIMDRQPTSAEMRFNLQQKFLTDDNTPNESYHKTQELPPPLD